MAEVFDPENVRIKVLDGDEDGLWTLDNEPDPLPLKLVRARDYNQLLALYREAIATNQAMDRKAHMKTQARKSKAISKAWAV